MSINQDGLFTCTNPLPGTFVGCTRVGLGTGYAGGNLYYISEFRAYTWVPLALSSFDLSADVMPNTSLQNSVRFNPFEFKLET